MGKVYAWEDVEARRIPRLEDFPVVIDHMREVFKKEKSILGGLICGSVLRGDHNCRSDIDCVVVYETKLEREAMEVLQGVSAFAGNMYVPVGFVPCDIYTASTRFHHIGPAFRIHLQMAIKSGGIVGTNPLTLLRTGGEDLIMEIESYLRMKVYNTGEALAKYSCMSIDHKCAFLQKVLEAPSHVARKILHLGASDENDAKVSIVTRYIETMPRHLGDGLRMLTSFDKRYTVEVLRQLERPDRWQYEECWSVLEELPYWLLDWLRGNIEHIERSRA